MKFECKDPVARLRSFGGISAENLITGRDIKEYTFNSGTGLHFRCSFHLLYMIYLCFSGLIEKADLFFYTTKICKEIYLGGGGLGFASKAFNNFEIKEIKKLIEGKIYQTLLK